VLIFKVVPQEEWNSAGVDYPGSAHDRSDGFLHFSTAAQLPETLRRYYAGRDDLVLLAVSSETLGAALKWEPSPSRGEDFPHLFAALPRNAVLWARALTRRPDGEFLLPL
jgi:uncharacterized protein (DUF952 family)